jgi:hypothetical protein
METPAVIRPDGFQVNDSGSELTISWGRVEVREKLPSIVLAALLLLLLPFLAVNWYVLVLFGLLLLASVYSLIAMFANHTTLRVTATDWVISRGPVPLPSTELYFRSAKHFHPDRLHGVVALKDPEKEDVWRPHSNNLAGLALEFAFEHILRRTSEPQLTYTLFGRRRNGRPIKLLSGLKEEEASYLKGMLEDRLRPDAWSGMEPRRDKTDQALNTLPCDTCRSSNPPASSFCCECGATLEPAGPRGQCPV